VFDDSPKSYTSPDDATTPRRENEIGTLTHSSLSSENASSVSSKAQVTPPNVLSKYLVQYVLASQEKNKASETRVTGLRVLTNAEGIAILKEKEEKKQKEKEKQKQDWLEKRNQREELAKRKADKRYQTPQQRKLLDPKRDLLLQFYQMPILLRPVLTKLVDKKETCYCFCCYQGREIW